MAKIKFKDNGHDERAFTIVDAEGVKLEVTSSAVDEGYYFTTISVGNGTLVGLTRKETVAFAMALLKEANH